MQVQSPEMEDHTNQSPALAWPLKHCRSQSQGLRRSLALFMQGLEVGKEQSQGEHALFPGTTDLPQLTTGLSP